MKTASSNKLFDRFCVIGGGLIGSSVLRAAKDKGICTQSILMDSNIEVCQIATDLNLADVTTNDLASAVKDANCVLLAVPVGQYHTLAPLLAEHLPPNCILTDVGSTKASFLEAFANLESKGIHLVPAHPVAGTENSGPTAGFATLFQNRWCILTPSANTNANAVESIKSLWSHFGANIEMMDAKHHDLVLAVTSHLPHLIAYNIVGTAADLEEVTQSEVIKFSAGGFRDFTRLAASDPTMWRDIFLNNKEAVLEILGRFNEDLSILAKAIRWGDGDALHDLFSRTRTIRRNIIEMGQESPDPDFGRTPKKS